MKKRVISILLTVLMLISLVSVFPISVSAAGAVAFEYGPALLLGGENEYNIVWKTSTPTLGYVTYSYNGQTYTVYDEEDGVVRGDDKYHTVHIPAEHLNSAQKYTVTSALVDSRTGHSVKLGATASREGKVKWSNKTDDIKIGCFSDIHLYDSHSHGPLERSIYALKNYMDGVDLITLNGDVVSICTTEKYLDTLYMAFEQFSADGTPILYTAGNHECRGITAQRLPEYFGFSETDDLYGRVKFGPIEFLVTFSGEDKIDEHQEYGDLNAMEHYKGEEFDWYHNCGGFSSDSMYRISISHSHNLMDVYYKDEFLSRVKEYDPDIHINGHTHAQKIETIDGYDFPFLHDGAHDDNTTMRTTLVTIKNGQYVIKGFNDGGTVTLEGTTPVKNYKKGAASEEIIEQQVTEAPKQEEPEKEIVSNIPEEKPVPTAAGVTTSSLKGASNTTAFTVKPTVFDGGKYFNVVWQTTPGVDATGEVIVNLAGNISLRFRSQRIGKITTDTTHSVKIPKESFATCKYEAKARVVINYTFGGYVTSPPTSYGTYVTSGQTTFKGEPTAKQTKYSLLAVSGITTMSYAEKLKAEVGNKKPDMLITLGNMVTSFETEKDFGNYLKVTQAITGGEYPVMFLRGENETKGAFAADVGKYIKSQTDEIQGTFYTNTNLNELSIIGLDTGTVAPDNTESYNGLVSFDAIRAKQADWLENKLPKSFAGTYNIVFANADNLMNCAGTSFAAGLKAQGTNLTVTAQSGKATMSLGLDTYSKAVCGTPEGDQTYGLLINCGDNKISVKALGGQDMGEIDVESSSASNDESLDNANPEQDTTGDNGKDENKEEKPDATDKEDTDKDDETDTSTDEKDDDEQEEESTDNGPEFIKGEFDGIDGDLYIREVEEGWYEEYVDLGYGKSGSPKSNGKTTELEFIQMVANLSSVNLYLYDGSTDAEKAAEWAEEYNIYNGYLGENPVSDDIISTIIEGLFPNN